MNDGGGENIEYDLKCSLDAVGYLYPTIVDKHNRIIDGQHRLKVDPNWPCFRLSHIETMTDYLMGRIIANMHRRQPAAEEKTEWLSELAEETGWSAEKIAERLGMSYDWVVKYLPSKYKDPIKAEKGRIGGKKSTGPSALHHQAEKLSEARREMAPGFHIKKNADDTDRFLDGLENLYFLKPGDELTTTLVNYCKTKNIHWSIVVTEGLKLFFHTQDAKPY